jgi:hypothetical protein
MANHRFGERVSVFIFNKLLLFGIYKELLQSRTIKMQLNISKKKAITNPSFQSINKYFFFIRHHPVS